MVNNDDFQFENQSELDDILYSMNCEDFLENEVEDQLDEGIFSNKKVDYLDNYLSKYKFYKKEYEANAEFVESLKDKKDNTIEFILNSVSDKFNFIIDEDSRTKKMAKTIYEFFVLDYRRNLKTMVINYINDNKKTIIPELKKKKKGKDISTTASKMNFANTNDALIINNVKYIIDEIIPNCLNEDFIELILDSDDSVANINMRDFIDENKITIDNQTFLSFIHPLINEEDGWSDIISDIVIKLTKNANLVDIDIFVD